MRGHRPPPCSVVKRGSLTNALRDIDDLRLIVGDDSVEGGCQCGIGQRYRGVEDHPGDLPTSHGLNVLAVQIPFQRAARIAARSAYIDYGGVQVGKTLRLSN